MTYLTCQTVTGIRREYHPASPLVDFMMQVIQISPSAYQAILGAGFLDVLLCLYACNFNSSISQRRGVDGKSRMLDACSDALTRLCKHPNAFIVISAHPLCKLWPESQTLPFRTTQTEMDRPLAWRQLGSVLVTRRLVSLPAILELPVSEDKSFLSEACVDLVEFATQVLSFSLLNRVWLKLSHIGNPVNMDLISLKMLSGASDDASSSMDSTGPR